MIIEKFTKNNIHYIKEIWGNGAINIYPDPEFQEELPDPAPPTLPTLQTPDQKLNFIINELRLKRRFQQ